MSATLYVESDTLFRLEEEDGSITAEILPGGVTLITAVAKAGARLSGATTNGVEWTNADGQIDSMGCSLLNRALRRITDAVCIAATAAIGELG